MRHRISRAYPRESPFCFVWGAHGFVPECRLRPCLNLFLQAVYLQPPPGYSNGSLQKQYVVGGCRWRSVPAVKTNSFTRSQVRLSVVRDTLRFLTTGVVVPHRPSTSFGAKATTGPLPAFMMKSPMEPIAAAIQGHSMSRPLTLDDKGSNGMPSQASTGENFDICMESCRCSLGHKYRESQNRCVPGIHSAVKLLGTSVSWSARI